MAQSFKNLLTLNGLYEYFEVLIYSEQLKVEKPNPRMFKAAIGAMDLEVQDCHRIMMVGNNLSRDVKGANQLGIISVHMNWTSRYPKIPANPSEQPDYAIDEPLELLELAERLNDQLKVKKAKASG
jgi:putative hydrolase of the HAD superfamily